MDFNSLIDAVALRTPGIRGGIMPASFYVGAVSSCFADDQCAAKWANICTPTQWMQALKESARKLTYTAPDMTYLGKAAYKPGTPNAVMDFDCILTSTRKDRDGDVLESEGAERDPRMPLLWQHMPMQPIGRMIETLSQGKDRVVIHCAIADIELGRDAATLVEFGALRISHGFKPLKYEPLPRGQEGFHILKFEIMEVSLVSIPSNTDAVITAFSRQKLHHPMVKSFAAGLWTRKPELVSGGWTKGGDACTGQCVRHLAKRFRRRLAKGRYPDRKSMKALHKMVKRALDENAKSIILELAKDHAPSPNSCICHVYDPGSPMKPASMCQKLCAALALGRVHTKTLNALDKSLKKARKAAKASKKMSRPIIAPLERGTVEHRRVAFHEAGHAIVAHLLGAPPVRASVGSKGCAAAGFNGAVHVDSKLREALPPSEQLLLNLAGFACERWAGFSPRKRSGQPDQKKATKLYARLAGRRPTDEELTRLIERSSGMFKEPALYEATTRVKSILCGCARGEASGEEINRAIDDTLGANRAQAAELVRSHAKDLVRV